MVEAFFLPTRGTLAIITAIFLIFLLAYSHYLYDLKSSKSPCIPLSFYDVIIAFFVYLGIPWLLITVFRPYFSWAVQNQKILLFVSLINVFHLLATFLFFLVFFLFLRKPLGKMLWKQSSSSYKKDIFIGVVTWPLAFCVMSLWNQLIEWIILYFSPDYIFQEQLPIAYLEQTQKSPIIFFLACIMTIVLAPLVEEFLFRGVLQNFLKTQMNNRLAIGISSVIFASFHYSFSQGLSNIPILSSLCIFSFFLGAVYEKQQSLLSSISLHALFNTISILYLLFFRGAG